MLLYVEVALVVVVCCVLDPLCAAIPGHIMLGKW